MEKTARLEVDKTPLPAANGLCKTAGDLDEALQDDCAAVQPPRDTPTLRVLEDPS